MYIDNRTFDQVRLASQLASFLFVFYLHSAEHFILTYGENP